jgi:hypothetical protein
MTNAHLDYDNEEPKSAHDQVKIEIICAKDIKPVAIDWVWETYLARGKLHIIAGKPASGKTTIAIELAAIISRGGNFPDGSMAQQGNILVWSSEDDTNDTLVPRFEAAGADMSRVHFVGKASGGFGSRPFDPSLDMKLLHTAVKAIGDVSLLIVDPIVSVVKGDTNSNSDTRKALMTIVYFAALTKCAVIGITHFTKGTAGGDPVERITGSISFGAVTRIAFIAAKSDHNDGKNAKRVLTRAKSSFGPDGDGFYYEIQNTILPGDEKISTSKVVWLGDAKGSARQLLSQTETPPVNKKTAIDDAANFLTESLQFGPIESNVIVDWAKAKGISIATLNRAKQNLGVESKRLNGSDKWSWVLPLRNEFEVDQCDQDNQVDHDYHPYMNDNVDNLDEMTDICDLS